MIRIVSPGGARISGEFIPKGAKLAGLVLQEPEELSGNKVSLGGAPSGNATGWMQLGLLQVVHISR
jgi:hypothetical protein